MDSPTHGCPGYEFVHLLSKDQGGQNVARARDLGGLQVTGIVMFQKGPQSAVPHRTNDHFTVRCYRSLRNQQIGPQVPGKSLG